MRKIYFTILLLLFAIQTFAQAPDTSWTKIFGGSGTDRAYCVTRTNDGGYILAGQTESFGYGMDDMWLIKTNAMGDTAWTRTYGGSEYDYCYDVKQTSDGGYILFGETYSFHPTFWYAYVVKTNSVGDTAWTSVIGEGRLYFARSGIEISGNDYLFTGRTKASSAGQEDLWLVRIDGTGDTVWTKTYGGPDDEQGITINGTLDGGFIIAAATKSFGSGNYDAWLIRMNSGFDTLWTKTYGGTESDLAQVAKQTNDHGFIFAGTTRSFGIPNNYNDVWIVKTNATGDTIWTRTFGSNSHCGALDVQQTSDGGYIVVGYNGLDSFNSDVWLIRTDEFGDTLWTALYGGANWEVGRSIEMTNDGGYIIAGDYYDNATSSRDAWLIKIAPDPTDIKKLDIKLIPKSFVLEQNYPNPFNPTTTIRFIIPYSVISTEGRNLGDFSSPLTPRNDNALVQLTVYDILGNEAATLVNEQKLPGIYEVEFNATNLSSGIYFYQLRMGNKITTKKMIILK